MQNTLSLNDLPHSGYFCSKAKIASECNMYPLEKRETIVVFLWTFFKTCENSLQAYIECAGEMLNSHKEFVHILKESEETRPLPAW